MQSATLLIREVVALVVSHELENSAFRQSGRLVEDKASLLDVGSERAHCCYCKALAAGPASEWPIGRAVRGITEFTTTTANGGAEHCSFRNCRKTRLARSESRRRGCWHRMQEKGKVILYQAPAEVPLATLTRRSHSDQLDRGAHRTTSRRAKPSSGSRESDRTQTRYPTKDPDQWSSACSDRA